MPLLRPRGTASLRVALVAVALSGAATTFAQQPPAPPAPAEAHEHVDVEASALTPATDTSGTAWQPRVTPMYGVHREWRGWDLRLDGSLFVQLVYEPGDRHRTGGAATHQIGGLDWGMIRARRTVGAGRVGFRGMASLEPLTLRDCGGLNLLATGEVCEGDTIHDRQQPHDLVMELALDYDRPLRGAWRWQVYAGLAGDPAFGPVGHPHRASAQSNPIAPITHHWFDATSAFGVVTVGIHDRRWKAEASAFNGRAPDERRTDLDLGAFDSVSARVSYLVSDRLALQASIARMTDARAAFEAQPDPAATRLAASATYHRPLGGGGLWASTLAYGVHQAREEVPGGVLDEPTSAALVETSLAVNGHTVFGRAEAAGMPAHHLHAHEYAQSIVRVGKLQVGYARQLLARRGAVLGLGGSASLSLLSTELAPRYGGRAAPGVNVFLHVRPERHAM